MEEMFHYRYKNVMEDGNLVIITGNLIKNTKDKKKKKRFPQIYTQEWDCGSHGNSLFCFLINIHAVLHKRLYQFTFLSMPQETSPSPASIFVDFFFSDGHSDCCDIIPHCSFYLNSSSN